MVIVIGNKVIPLERSIVAGQNRGPYNLGSNVHWSPLVRSVFYPMKVDLTNRLTLHQGYNSVKLILIGTS